MLSAEDIGGGNDKPRDEDMSGSGAGGGGTEGGYWQGGDSGDMASVTPS